MTAKRLMICLAGLVALGGLLTGCGPAEPTADAGSAAVEEPTKPPAASSTRPKASRRAKRKPAKAEDLPRDPDSRSLGDLLKTHHTPRRRIPNLKPLKIDEALVAAAGIRKLSGKRLVLYTDLSPDSELDVLPAAFDQAFAGWCEYFDVDPAKISDWRMTGFLIDDSRRFTQAGLLPSNLPPFEHGYSRNDMLWLYEQPSVYYRRHLLLHEGTHGFMNTVLGGCGPPWYSEGIAELLSTHRWHEGQLTLNWMPTSREEVPMWGRIKTVRDAVAEDRALYIENVIEYDVGAHRESEPYAWCWAAATLLDRHPKYRERFRQLYKTVNQSGFTDRFVDLIGDDWGALSEQWRVFVMNLEYGHDVPKTAIDFTPGQPISAAGAEITVAADRGWQNTGLRLEAGTTYRLTAQGRYQVADEPQVWWCEPGGVSIRYYRRVPLGALMAAVRPDEAPERSPDDPPRPLVRPVVVGLGATLTPEEAGTLHLQINDSPGELDDNRGSLSVKIRPEPPNGAGPIDNQGA